MLQAEWFRGKTCLDIGCNDGQFTLTVAEQMLPRAILGIDVDKHLIESANSRVKRIKYDLSKSSKPAPAVASKMMFMPRTLALQKTTNPSRPITATSSGCRPYPDNAAFAVRDAFALSEGSNRYDAVLCLSVTKWIHLNRGDEGLLEFFGIMHTCLKVGGLLVLEYQPWKSYEKRRLTSANTAAAFQQIRIRPAHFEEVLLSRFAFELVERLGPSEEQAAGFSRPLLVLRKTSSSQPQQQQLQQQLLQQSQLQEQPSIPASVPAMGSEDGEERSRKRSRDPEPEAQEEGDEEEQDREDRGRDRTYRKKHKKHSSKSKKRQS